MLGGRLHTILKYSIAGTLVGGTALSLRANQYQLDSIGVVRLSRAASTVFQIGIIYKVDLYGRGLDKKSIEYKELKSECHKKAAEKLLKLCCTNKGVYIKVGQHIAALEYLLPSEYVETMKVLHCHAPTNKIEDIFKVIKEDLQKDPFELFESIEPEPLGTASLAQVHKAKLKDGSIVAVKVQHPYVQGNSRIDMKTMEYLVKIMSWVFPEFKFQWLVDESKKNILRELDFAQEGHNAEKISILFQDVKWLKVPKVRWDLTTPRVLTMDFVEGGQVNDVEYIQKHNINPREVSDKLGKLYSRMIFIHGFVHSDPHPGNILVNKSDKGFCNIVLLDHGLYAELKDEFKVEYANLWLSILNRDRKAMRQHSKNLGIDGDAYGLFACMVTGRTWDSIIKGIDKEQLSKSEASLMKQSFTGILPQISEVLQNVNPQMLLILKTNDLMRDFPDEPPLPPSNAQASLREAKKEFESSVFFTSVKKLFMNKGFFIHMIAYSINVGVFSAVGTLLNQFILQHFENASEDAGRMGFMMVVAGMIGSILFGIMLDKTHKYKEINLFLYLSSALSILSLMYSLEYRSLVMTYIGCINVGTFTNSYMPVGFELAMELTFPSEESTTTGILMAGTQILGVVFTVALGYFNIWMGCFWALATQCALLFLGTIVTALVPNTLLRQEAYKESYVSSQRKVSYHGSRLVFIE